MHRYTQLSPPFGDVKLAKMERERGWLPISLSILPFVLFCFVLFCFGLVWFGLVWFGLVWFGLVWFGLVWFGLVWFGLVWFFLFVLFWFVFLPLPPVIVFLSPDKQIGKYNASLQSRIHHPLHAQLLLPCHFP